MCKACVARGPIAMGARQWRRNEFESGGTGPERSAGKKFFGSKSTISRFGESFRDGQLSSVSFLFAVFLLTEPPYPAICKSGGGHVPPCPINWSRRHWAQTNPE